MRVNNQHFDSVDSVKDETKTFLIRDKDFRT